MSSIRKSSLASPLSSKSSVKRRRKLGVVTNPGEITVTNSNTIQLNILKTHKTILINLKDVSSTWYDYGGNFPGRNETILSLKHKNMHSSSLKYNRIVDISLNKYRDWNNRTGIVDKYRCLANEIYRREVELFCKKYKFTYSDTKDDQWIETTMRRGTLRDRIAAMSVAAATHPIHKLHALDMLLSLAGVSISSIYSYLKHDNKDSGVESNKRVKQMAAEALVDLFTNTYMPSKRRLVGMDARPFFLYNDLDIDKNEIENKYNNSGRRKEQVHSVSQKQTEHKMRLSLRPQVLLLWRFEEMVKGRYSAFLSQYLGKTISSASLHTSTIDIYKSMALKTASELLKGIPEAEQVLLPMIVNKIGDPSRKIAALAGQQLRLLLEVHPNMMIIVAREVQQLAHRPHLSPRVLYNCVIFLNQLKLGKDNVENNNISGVSYSKNSKQCYNRKNDTTVLFSLPTSLINTYFLLFEALVRKDPNTPCGKPTFMKSRLLSALLTGVNRTYPYLSLKNGDFMRNHIDALYRITDESTPSVCTQALILIFRLTFNSSLSKNCSDKTHKSSVPSSSIICDNTQCIRFYRTLYLKVGETEMLHTGKQLTLFFNLIYKAMKFDADNMHVVAIAKRLFYSALHHGPSVISATLFLISEVIVKNSHLHRIFYSEIYPKVNELDQRKSEIIGTSTFSNNNEKFEHIDNAKFNGCRNLSMDSFPNDCLWEISLSLYHYHPSVSFFAENLGDISYRGDPLRDFNLAPFLDKFVLKNPKLPDEVEKISNEKENTERKLTSSKGHQYFLKSLKGNFSKMGYKDVEEILDIDAFSRFFFAEKRRRDKLKCSSHKSKTVAEAEDSSDHFNAKSSLSTNEFRSLSKFDTSFNEEDFVSNLAENFHENVGDLPTHYDSEDPHMESWSYESNNDDDYSIMDNTFYEY